MINPTPDTYEFTAIPTFGISDYHAAIDFYIGFLGFKIDWEHRFGQTDPVYMQISKNGLTLHLSENKRFPTNVIVFVETRKIAEFHKELQGKGSTYKLPDILQTNWQTLQLEIADPFGNLLRFNENI
ncbi:MAG: glyoxalase superfamily protein [Bacteroidia bacterium]|jgi:catechol 2,3-dioxygenase-like lactoylglutathione lyase family enzyme|nr:glyoxalase superfamily protein [Bacteroidia bacterium]